MCCIKSSAEEKRNAQIDFDDDKDIKELQLPIKPRTAYQMFVKMECNRLREVSEERFRKISYRNMATESWRHLSPSERVVYTSFPVVFSKICFLDPN